MFLAICGAAAAAGCVVRGGEERDRESPVLPAAAAIIRFEAKNADGTVVGSGCVIDDPQFYSQIRFRAELGDTVTLREEFSIVASDDESAKDHKNDAEYWCRQSHPTRYTQVPDARCWQAVAPGNSHVCFDEEGVAGTVQAVVFVPDVAEPKTGSLDGFELTIDVVGTGKQCVKCATAGSTERLAFVVE